MPPEGSGDRVWRCRLAEGYEVLIAGTKGSPLKTRCRAWRALIPFCGPSRHNCGCGRNPQGRRSYGRCRRSSAAVSFILRSRSERLLSKGTEKSRMKARMPSDGSGSGRASCGLCSACGGPDGEVCRWVRQPGSGQADIHDPQIALWNRSRFSAGKEARPASGRYRPPLDLQEMVDHSLGPLLILFFPQEEEFAQKMRVAEGMVTVVLQIGIPEVVDGAARKSGRMSAASMAWRSAPLVREVPGEPVGRDGVQQCRLPTARTPVRRSRPLRRWPPDRG